MKTLLSLFVLAGFFTATATAQVLGTKPGYTLSSPVSLPNEEAIVRRIWVPGLDDGFVPQGLTVEGGHLLVSGYVSTEPKVGTGPCRIYRVDMETGAVAGTFNMPVHRCTHAGGLGYAGGATVVLADTRQLHRIDLARAMGGGPPGDAIKGTVNLAGELRGSLGAFDGEDAWIGTWTKDASKARMFRLPMKLFDEADGQTVDHGRAVESLPIPLEAQGATFDRKGHVWISASNSRQGYLYRLDRKTGAVLSRHYMVVGLEDLAFDSQGRLWGVSESGARKYLHWTTHFPVIFAIDVARLK